MGPATSTPEKIRELVDVGMNVARLNLSHGSYADHEAIYQMIRQASDESGHAVGVLVDLQGPKITAGQVRRGPDRWWRPETSSPSPRARSRARRAICGTTYSGLPTDVERRRHHPHRRRPGLPCEPSR